MLSLRSRVFVFCLSIAIFWTLKIFAFDGYVRLQTKLASHSASDVDSAFEATGQDNTLGIASKIYVLSLPARTDRRRDMEHLRKVLGLQWTYVNAIDSQNAIIERIMDSVRLVRQTRHTDSVFTWPDQQVPLTERIDIWDPAFLAPSSARSGQPSRSPPLVCAAQNDTIVSYNANLPAYQILTGARIACWHSHLSVIYTIANDFTLRQDDAVIVLEDDIDMEQDIHRRLRNVWPFLPTGWDIVYLGHCWSDEGYKRPLDGHLNLTISNATKFDTHMHPSNRPLCTHAYALSRSGARRLLLHLRYPFFAYSRSIDKAILWLIECGRLKSFSVVPSIVIQRKVGTSDIMSGKGSGWRAELIDGVFGTI